MAMKQHEMAALGLSAIGIAVLVYTAIKMEPYGMKQQRYADEVGVSIGGIFDEIHPHEEGNHFCHPDMVGGPVVYLPHMYPPRVGHEITTLMEFGFPALQREKPQDYDWIVRPPSEDTL